MGAAHEQKRKDVSDHVNIIWDNIQPDRESNFQPYDEGDDANPYPYDLSSVLHYPLDVCACEL